MGICSDFMHKTTGSCLFLPVLYTHGEIDIALPTRVTPPNIPKKQKGLIYINIGYKDLVKIE